MCLFSSTSTVSQYEDENSINFAKLLNNTSEQVYIVPESFWNQVKMIFFLLGIPYKSVYDMYSPEYAYDEDNEASEEEDVEKAPEFVSETMNLVVNEGETISLPCIVTR